MSNTQLRNWRLGIGHWTFVLHRPVPPSRRFGYRDVGRSSRMSAMPVPRYDLEDRLINFAVQICLLTDRFPSTPIARHVSTQITRSGTSPFANYGEAQAAESRQDFVHKLKVCLKELRETQAWLKFADRMNLCPEHIEADLQLVHEEIGRAHV